jgi:hypothetical protein
MPNDPSGHGGKSNKPRTPNPATSKTPINRTPTSKAPTSKRTPAERQTAKKRALALAARRRRNRQLGIGSVLTAVVIVVALVAVWAAGGRGGSTGASVTSPAAGTPVPAAITIRLASIPLSTLAAAPASSLVAAPQTITDPKLTVDGKPDLLYVGAEFCPVCATERWAMYVALSKFGTFSRQPGQIHSAVQDGDISTLTFYGTTYSSPYFSFTPVETTTNQPQGNFYVSLQTPTTAQKTLWLSHTAQTIPWVDFGGRMELTTAQYDPSVLEGVSFTNIANDIGNNATAIGAGVDASAKVLIQTICSTLSGNKPAAVCSALGHG